VTSGYRKFSSRFASDGDNRKTFASFATFADGGRNFEAQTDADKARIDAPEIQSASVKVAQVAKVETPEAVCAVCNAAGDLWHFGDTIVHEQCAAFLPKPEPAEPSAAYRAASAEPDGTGCKVTIVEIPAKGLRFRLTYAHLQLRSPACVPEDRWRQCIEDGRAFLHQWGESAQRLGWMSADLFGLHQPPERPHPSYRRLSRYDSTGLIWLLQGRPVVALTVDTASIRRPTGSITVFRKNNRPAYGPVGDSLDDFK
jgi:hypothetical protein